jgi:hypothetical protein
MRLVDIINKSDNRSKERAAKQGLTAKLYKVEDNKILYTVTSSQGNRQYIVTIQLLGLTGNKLRSLKGAINGNIKLSCTCPAFLFQGYKYIMWKSQSGIDREIRSPDKTNPNKEGMACKHILVALNKLKSDYSQIYQMFKEQIPKGKNKFQPTDIKDNSKSDTPTELDIKIVTDFKTACDKLYKDYTDFLSSDHLSSDKFTDSKFYDKVDPSKILAGLSKPVVKSLSGKFIGKCKSLADILKLINQKKNGFNVMLSSDVKALTNKLNSVVNSTEESYVFESFINDIILSLMCS